ncbi:MAG TPA: hypothetical protein PKA64_11645, partial [Myxococcota bacterium]|nr:hypothetical protein [Myxococcota bacterium]
MIVVALAGVALAQSSPRATALEVLTIDPDTPCPTVPSSHAVGVVRTNIGLMRRTDDGTYAYGCPSRWGGDPEARLSVSPDGEVWLIVSSGGVWVSEDGGCAARQVALPEGLVATDTLTWRGAPWVLGEVPAEGAGALLRWDGAELVLVRAWPDFVPDGMLPDGADHLWLSGAGPTAQVRRLSFSGGLGGDEALAGLPLDVRDVERLVPVASEGGEAWFRVERYTDRWLWSAAVSGDAVTFADDGQRWKNVLGPVQLDGRWWMVADQVLHRADPGAPAWTATDAKPGWTCLHTLGGQVFACTVPVMLGVIGIGPRGTTNTAEVFTLAMVGGPDPACGAAPACEADWQDLGGQAGVADAD